jgi:chemotaxis protein MotB
MKKKILWLALGAAVLGTGCVSTGTLEKKDAELKACEARMKSEAEACAKAKGEQDAALAEANKELGVHRQVAEERKKQLEATQAQEQDLRQRLQKELTDKNVEIEQLKGQLSVRMLDRIVFKAGSADILPQGLVVLDKLAAALKGTTDLIRIEGHTDPTPIGGALKDKYPSNWELSAARAASVVRYFETKHEISPKRLVAVGLAQHRPVAANDTPENMQRNRRVEIVLRPVKEGEFDK